MEVSDPTTIYCDNLSSIQLAKNLVIVCVEIQAEHWTNRLGRISVKPVRNKRPDWYINPEVIRQIFRKGIYFGGSVELSYEH